MLFKQTDFSQLLFGYTGNLAEEMISSSHCVDKLCGKTEENSIFFSIVLISSEEKEEEGIRAKSTALPLSSLLPSFLPPLALSKCNMSTVPPETLEVRGTGKLERE